MLSVFTAINTIFWNEWLTIILVVAVSWMLITSNPITRVLHELSNYIFVTIWARFYYLPRFTDKEIETLSSHTMKEWESLDLTPGCWALRTRRWPLLHTGCLNCAWFRKQGLSPNFQRILTTCLLKTYCLHFTNEKAEVQTRGFAHHHPTNQWQSLDFNSGSWSPCRATTQRTTTQYFKVPPSRPSKSWRFLRNVVPL